MTVERFWQLTPAELSIELEAWEIRQERNDYRIGLLCATILEPHRDRDKKKEPFSPTDFMPNKKLKEQPKQQTSEEQLEIIKVLNTALGGEFVIS